MDLNRLFIAPSGTHPFAILLPCIKITNVRPRLHCIVSKICGWKAKQLSLGYTFDVNMMPMAMHSYHVPLSPSVPQSPHTTKQQQQNCDQTRNATNEKLRKPKELNINQKRREVGKHR